VSITAIVLAGGRSSRFGGDKLAADLDGQPLLAATIAAVTRVADAVIVAGSALPDRFRADDVPVVLVVDRDPFAGPLVALDGILRDPGLDPTDLAVIVGGDMPRLVPGVLRSMLDALGEDHAIEAVLLARPGIAEGAAGEQSEKRPVLPLAVRVGAAMAVSSAAVESGERSLIALVDRLIHVDVPASTWLAIDPDARTLLDVDTQSDLERLRAN
jgi:molybdenum cofactor guanylyltransferase